MIFLISEMEEDGRTSSLETENTSRPIYSGIILISNLLSEDYLKGCELEREEGSSLLGCSIQSPWKLLLLPNIFLILPSSLLSHPSIVSQGTLEWRRSFQPDIIVPSSVSIEGETGKHVISGFDHFGRPVLYLRPGRENTKPSDRQIRYLVWSLERALDFAPKGVEKIIIFVDFKAATNQTNPGLGTALKVLNILQNHYVERLGRAIVVNLPWVLKAFMA